MKKLTAKEQRFVEEYLIDLNATQAYKRAGYKASSDDSAGVSAFRLLRKAKVQEAVQDARAKRSERTQIDADWVIKRLAAIANADITRVSEWGNDGLSLKDSSELDWVDSYSITEVQCDETVKQSADGKGKETILSRRKKVRQADKLAALAELLKHVERTKSSEVKLPEVTLVIKRQSEVMDDDPNT